MLYAPLNEGLDAVGRGISVVSPDTLIKPGSTLSNLGSVRPDLLMTTGSLCLQRLHPIVQAAHPTA